MVSRCPGFHLCGPGQGQPHGFAGEAVKYFDGVTYSVNGRVAGLEVGVDFNATGFTDGKPRVFGQGGFRADSHGHHDGVGFDLPATGKFNGIAANFFHAVFYYQGHAVIQHLFMENLGHVVIKRRHDLVHGFDQGDFITGVYQVFRNFATDKAAAHNSNVFCLVGADIDIKLCDVHHIANTEDVFVADAFDSTRQNGLAARRKD